MEQPDQSRMMWESALQELRVTQTGTQVMSGFLLSLVFQPTFRDLHPVQVGLYLVLAVLSGLATMLALVPIGAHRIICRGSLPAWLVRLAGGVLVATTLVVLGIVLGVLVLICSFII